MTDRTAKRTTAAAPAAPAAAAALPAHQPAAEPLLVDARTAARLFGIGLATWRRHDAAGKVPAPVRLGGGVLWRRAELADWTAAGGPDRRTWELLRAGPAQRDGRPRRAASASCAPIRPWNHWLRSCAKRRAGCCWPGTSWPAGWTD